MIAVILREICSLNLADKIFNIHLALRWYLLCKQNNHYNLVGINTNNNNNNNNYRRQAGAKANHRQQQSWVIQDTLRIKKIE